MHGVPTGPTAACPPVPASPRKRTKPFQTHTCPGATLAACKGGGRLGPGLRALECQVCLPVQPSLTPRFPPERRAWGGTRPPRRLPSDS